MTPRGAITNSVCLVAVAVVLLFLLSGTAADAATRIVPIGDSITKGMINTDDGGDHPTYRYSLWSNIRSNGKSVDFVGSWSEPNFPFVSFDQDNEGHGGYTIGGILRGVDDDPSHLSDWLPRYSAPDIALILLGTNDVLAQVPLSTRFSNMEGIINTLRSRNPNMKIFIAKIPPTGDSYRNQNSQLYAFNDQLPGKVGSWNTAQSPVTVVDCFSGYDGRNFNQAPRYIHPNAAGERLIADRFYAAIAPYLAGGPTPTTTKPTPTTIDNYAISGPRTIDGPGSYYLTRDIVNSNEYVFLKVQSSGVTIDGRGHRVDGIADGSQAGIVVDPGANGVTIKNLRLTDWAYGIYCTGASNGRIEGCTIEDASWGGVVLYVGSNGNTVTGNTIAGTHYGIYIGESTNNRVYNNRLSAPEDANLGNNVGGTTWYVSKQSGPNVIGGASIGGNYWSNPSGTGFSDTGIDANRDGFVDQPYQVIPGQSDGLPLASLNAPTGTPTPTPTAGPYGTHVLPGTIEAEDYDNGGEGVAYHDTTAGNQGLAYRSDGVDIETDGGVTDVCFVRAGEWLKYSVDTSAAGSYALTIHAANPDATAKAVKVAVDGVAAGEAMVGVTGGWSAYQDFAGSAPLTIPAGRHALTLTFDGVDRVNLDRLSLAAAATQTPTPTPTPTPTVNVTPTANVTPTETPTPNVTPPPLAPVPGGAGVPTDTDGDGRYDDVNGNLRADFADVVLYFGELAWIEVNEPRAQFDFNENGRIDFADIVWLFDHL